MLKLITNLRVFQPPNHKILDNFWETALAIGWKDMVDWKETPPTSRTSLLSFNSFADASISASQYTPDTAGVDALLGAAL